MICQDIVGRKGAESRYAKDCQIRAVRGRPFPEAAAMLGWTDPPPIIIHAGIGTLVLGETEEFTPAPRIASKAASWLKSLSDRAQATEDEIGQRQAACRACPLRNPDTDACTACGCGLKSKIRLKAQVCPKGLWPVVIHSLSTSER